MHWRTATIEVTAQTLSGVKEEKEVDALLDCSVSATKAAIESKHELLDWDEYRVIA